MRWAELEEDAPRLAAFAEERLVAPGVLLVATTRRDGTPRLSAVEPLLLDGDLWLSMLWRSRKAADLHRDDRCLVHNIVTTRDGSAGEVKVRGRAIDVGDPEPRRRYRAAVTAAALGWRPEEPWFHLFRVDVDDVTVIRYEPTGDQRVSRWPARREYLRRSMSATSVGDPEPAAHFFGADRD